MSKNSNKQKRLKNKSLATQKRDISAAKREVEHAPPSLDFELIVGDDNNEICKPMQQ